METDNANTLPILALPKGSVLLPGTTLRVPVTGRSDVPALLSAVFASSRAPRPAPSSIRIGCVPINSPLLRSDGQLLLDDSKRKSNIDVEDDGENLDQGQIDHRQLFMYGTVAKISGVQGRKTDDLALIVEGVRRFRIDRFVQMRPYFVAEVANVNENEGKYAGE